VQLSERKKKDMKFKLEAEWNATQVNDAAYLADIQNKHAMMLCSY